MRRKTRTAQITDARVIRCTSLRRTNTQSLLVSFREEQWAEFECSAFEGPKGETEEVL